MGPSTGLSASAATLVGKNGLHTLEYRTSLWHLVYNEYNDANKNPLDGRLFSRLKNPGPYGFQALGAAAFVSFARTVEVPSILLALKKKKHRV